MIMDNFFDELNIAMIFLMIFMMLFGINYFLYNPSEFENFKMTIVENKNVIYPLLTTTGGFIVLGLLVKGFSLLTGVKRY